MRTFIWELLSAGAPSPATTTEPALFGRPPADIDLIEGDE